MIQKFNLEKLLAVFILFLTYFKLSQNSWHVYHANKDMVNIIAWPKD